MSQKNQKLFLDTLLERSKDWILILNLALNQNFIESLFKMWSASCMEVEWRICHQFVMNFPSGHVYQVEQNVENDWERWENEYVDYCCLWIISPVCLRVHKVVSKSEGNNDCSLSKNRNQALLVNST